MVYIYIGLIDCLQNSVLLCSQDYTSVFTGWQQHSVQSPPPFKKFIHANTTRHPLVPLFSYRSPIAIHNEFVLTRLGLICCFVHNKLYVRSPFIILRRITFVFTFRARLCAAETICASRGQQSRAEHSLVTDFSRFPTAFLAYRVKNIVTSSTTHFNVACIVHVLGAAIARTSALIQNTFSLLVLFLATLSANARFALVLLLVFAILILIVDTFV